MLRIAIPKGSLEEGTFALFKQAELPIERAGDRDYSLSIDDLRISETMMLRPPEIASYVSEGEFDIGITGKDWVIETESAVMEVADLKFSRGGWNSIKLVLATDESNPISNLSDIKPDARVATEYPRITRRFFKKIKKGKVRIRMSYGATEVKVPRLADYLVDVTETGTTLRRNGKKILATLLVSSTLLIANQEAYKDPGKRQEINEITALLLGVVDARNKVLLKVKVESCNLEILLEFLVKVSLDNPVVSKVFSKDLRPEWFQIEAIVRKSELNVTIPEIRKRGAKRIIEVDITKMIL